MEKEPKFCQSCGMPLTEEVLGTNADGSKNEEYCKYCYLNGTFNCKISMEEMADYCSQFLDQFNECSGKNYTREEYKQFLLSFYPKLKRWSSPESQLPSEEPPIKKELIKEVNELNIPYMPKIDNLIVLDGSYINMQYNINGNQVFFLDNSKTYWGYQVEKQDQSGHCFGIACDENYIMVSEYGKDGADAEIVIFKRRK